MLIEKLDKEKGIAANPLGIVPAATGEEAKPEEGKPKEKQEAGQPEADEPGKRWNPASPRRLRGCPIRV
jgi:hypothetical protein